MNAQLATGGFVAAAIGAYYLRKGVFKEFGRAAITYGLTIAAVFSILLAFSGHYQAVEVTDYQPTKVAALAGHWDEGPIPLGIIGYLDVKNGTTHAIEIPGGISFLASADSPRPTPA